VPGRRSEGVEICRLRILQLRNCCIQHLCVHVRGMRHKYLRILRAAVAVLLSGRPPRKAFLPASGRFELGSKGAGEQGSMGARGNRSLFSPQLPRSSAPLLDFSDAPCEEPTARDRRSF
jgi:hypothetical protein